MANITHNFTTALKKDFRYLIRAAAPQDLKAVGKYDQIFSLYYTDDWYCEAQNPVFSEDRKSIERFTGTGKIRAFDDSIPYLNRLAERGFNVYWLPFDTDGLRGVNIRNYYHIFAENDSLPLDVQMTRIERLRTLNFEPSLIVFSGSKSYHAYWNIEGLDIASYKRLNRLLCVELHSDTTIPSNARQMRLGGVTRKVREGMALQDVLSAGERFYTVDYAVRLLARGEAWKLAITGEDDCPIWKYYKLLRSRGESEGSITELMALFPLPMPSPPSLPSVASIPQTPPKIAPRTAPTPLIGQSIITRLETTLEGDVDINPLIQAVESLPVSIKGDGGISTGGFDYQQWLQCSQDIFEILYYRYGQEWETALDLASEMMAQKRIGANSASLRKSINRFAREKRHLYNGHLLNRWASHKLPINRGAVSTQGERLSYTFPTIPDEEMGWDFENLLEDALDSSNYANSEDLEYELSLFNYQILIENPVVFCKDTQDALAIIQKSVDDDILYLPLLITNPDKKTLQKFNLRGRKVLCNRDFLPDQMLVNLQYDLLDIGTELAICSTPNAPKTAVDSRYVLISEYLQNQDKPYINQLDNIGHHLNLNAHVLGGEQELGEFSDLIENEFRSPLLGTVIPIQSPVNSLRPIGYKMPWFVSPILALKASTGTGKTQAIKGILNWIEKVSDGAGIGYQIRSLSHRNMLGYELADKLGLVHIHDIKPGEDYPTKRQACIDSVHKMGWDNRRFEGASFKVLLLDEIDQMLDHLFYSEPLSERRQDVISKFERLVIEADLIICASATLHDFDLQLIEYIKGQSAFFVDWKHQRNPHRLKVLRGFTDENFDKTLDLISNSLNEQKRVIIATDQKKKSELLSEVLRRNKLTLRPDGLSVFPVNENQVLIVNSDTLTTDSRVQGLLKSGDKKRWLEANDIKLLIHTPTLPSGVSFVGCFDVKILIAGGGSVSIEGLHQMLNRERLPIDCYAVINEYSPTNGGTGSPLGCSREMARVRESLDKSGFCIGEIPSHQRAYLNKSKAFLKKCNDNFAYAFMALEGREGHQVSEVNRFVPDGFFTTDGGYWKRAKNVFSKEINQRLDMGIVESPDVSESELKLLREKQNPTYHDRLILEKYRLIDDWKIEGSGDALKADILAMAKKDRKGRYVKRVKGFEACFDGVTAYERTQKSINKTVNYRANSIDELLSRAFNHDIDLSYPKFLLAEDLGLKDFVAFLIDLCGDGSDSKEGTYSQYTDEVSTFSDRVRARWQDVKSLWGFNPKKMDNCQIVNRTLAMIGLDTEMVSKSSERNADGTYHQWRNYRINREALEAVRKWVARRGSVNPETSWQVAYILGHKSLCNDLRPRVGLPPKTSDSPHDSPQTTLSVIT